MRALADLQRAGAIRYFGVSNFKAWRIARICAICDAEGIDRPVVSQPLYHALNRTRGGRGAAGLRPRSGIGVVRLQPDRARRAHRQVRQGRAAAGRQPCRRAGTGACWRPSTCPRHWLRPRASSTMPASAGIEPVAFATAWVLANPIVTAAIAGPRTMAAVAELSGRPRGHLERGGRTSRRSGSSPPGRPRSTSSPIRSTRWKGGRRAGDDQHRLRASPGRELDALAAAAPVTLHEVMGQTGAMQGCIRRIYPGMRLQGTALTVDSPHRRHIAEPCRILPWSSAPSAFRSS